METDRPVKTLIVDDDPELLNVIAAGFKTFGFDVSTAGSGDEAWEVSEKESPDVVISDIRMAGGDGVQLLQRIKEKNPRSPRVILITGYSDRTLDELFHLGADGVFQKPFSAKKIRETITRVSLEPSRRWSIRCTEEVKHSFSKTIENIHEALHAGAISVGRGGLYLQERERLPDVGERVAFEIKIKDGYPCDLLKGIGATVWTRKSDQGKLKSGFGVELEYLDDCCLEQYTRWLKTNRITSFIPRV